MEVDRGKLVQVCKGLGEDSSRTGSGMRDIHGEPTVREEKRMVVVVVTIAKLKGWDSEQIGYGAGWLL